MAVVQVASFATTELDGRLRTNTVDVYVSRLNGNERPPCHEAADRLLMPGGMLVSPHVRSLWR